MGVYLEIYLQVGETTSGVNKESTLINISHDSRLHNLDITVNDYIVTVVLKY